jgi:hypothetical protein
VSGSEGIFVTPFQGFEIFGDVTEGAALGCPVLPRWGAGIGCQRGGNKCLK